ncbi:hypothetical protein FVEG_05326 [Fusarium verticillioides 7600]|uniref:Uncharacterized protein n=1 Tax=Gibberella moniliformis (strain M3125 / FGSC 7600) TaxID=334819 RepID=W7M9R4_GIBM7|nr:hypothetical protein FVEG_05326 [Fusarium verticillioides 7600]EWG44169.1 hypothetical protein FVEG_05326 [Fusarium verticillioides 7600]
MYKLSKRVLFTEKSDEANYRQAKSHHVRRQEPFNTLPLGSDFFQTSSKSSLGRGFTRSPFTRQVFTGTLLWLD